MCAGALLSFEAACYRKNQRILPLGLNCRALDFVVLQQQRDDKKNDIEQEHDGSKQPRHLPFTERNCDNHCNQHYEEQEDRTEEPCAADLHRNTKIYCTFNQPWQRQPAEKKRLCFNLNSYIHV